MKKSLATFCLGAALLVGLTSCQSTKDGGYDGAFEEATIMSDELPPWILEGSDEGQIAAGATTDRNKFAIPEGGESTASATSQNHPEVAANNSDDVIVEDGDTPAWLKDGADTPATSAPSAPATPTTVKNDKPAVAVNTPSKPSNTVKTPSKTGSKTGNKTASTKKPTRVAKFDKPTMVVYKVKKGDNLSLIAKRSNTTVDAIRKASGVKGDKIVAGQTIKVPYTPNGYKPTSKTNSASSSKSSGKSTVKTGGSGYTVKNGDTISAIAARNGVSTAALLKANGLSAQDASKIRAGRKLTIPGKAAPAPAKSSSKASSKSSSSKKVTKKSSKKR